MMPEDFTGLKDRKGRVDPSVASMKVVEVIESCQTPEQLEGARQLVDNFYALYNDWIFDETEEEITMALEDKARELHIDVNV